MKNISKYKPFKFPELSRREWPGKQIAKAPIWCSVDLRDGNQALAIPMSVQKKLEMFRMLLRIGFKEIEIGFPSASQVEYDFLRKLIEGKMIPPDMTIQVLTQSREHLIEKTCESLEGAKKAIIHLYNSTSELQRRVVFRMGRYEVTRLAVQGVEWIKKYKKKYLADTKVTLEYSPESFTATEPNFAIEICEKVVEAWKPAKGEKIILNLPATVEMSTPNVFADQIEYFCKNFKYRKQAIISLHCHNDRGTAVAATELGILAGADRVEGTLFGNGERTGNADIVTLALNMYSQGTDPKLDLKKINEIGKIYSRCTGMNIYSRHPYAGELVFTAFSGSHQDAIKKGINALTAKRGKMWEVPYLPMDPRDIGREYEPIIRINSQSGKGGIAFIMEKNFGYRLPRPMQQSFAGVIQKISDGEQREIMPEEILGVFREQYVNLDHPYELAGFSLKTTVGDKTMIEARIKEGKKIFRLKGAGNGPIDAFVKAFSKRGQRFTLTLYEQHAIEKGSDAQAAAYVEIVSPRNESFFGVGVDGSIVNASIKAVISAINKLSRKS